MEYIDGKNLNVLVKEEKSLSERIIQRFTIQILNAIAYMHYKKIIHRDLKSSNIMIVNGKQVKVIDFGMSKQVDSAKAPQKDDCIAGTLAYMAPETVNGGKLND